MSTSSKPGCICTAFSDSDSACPVCHPPAGPTQHSVHPATLGIRDLVMAGVTVAGVYGGAEGQVWVATFADPGEAQAFILASNHFKQPVNGYLLGDTSPKVITDGARKPS